MKNVEQILQDIGIELTDEQKKTLNKEVNENYRTINDYNTQKQKLETAEQTAKDNETALNNFKKELEKLDVKDIDEVKAKFTDYQTSLSSQKDEYERKIKSLELETVLKAKADELKCKDYDLARSQIDIEKAFNSLKENKPILFSEEEPNPKGKGGIIGSSGNTEEEKQEALLRSAMGLETKGD